MNFIEVVDALEIIKEYCQEAPDCKKCRLHDKDDASSCGVSPKGKLQGKLPARWEFDFESLGIVPSIFK